MKVGEEIVIEKDTLIETTPSGNVLEIKAGDKAIGTKMGIKYLTGNARGKTNISYASKVKGYDVDNICNRIAKALINNFTDIEEYMEDYDITTKDLEEVIYDELNEYI